MKTEIQTKLEIAEILVKHLGNIDVSEAISPLQEYIEEQLRIGGVSKSFKVVDIDLFDYKQITIVNEKEKYIVCHMYTMDNVDINRVRKQAKAMCDALNVY